MFSSRIKAHAHEDAFFSSSDLLAYSFATALAKNELPPPHFRISFPLHHRRPLKLARSPGLHFRVLEGFQCPRAAAPTGRARQQHRAQTGEDVLGAGVGEDGPEQGEAGAYDAEGRFDHGPVHGWRE